MAVKQDTLHVPIYEKDGNKFFVIHLDFQASTADDAMKIGWGSMLVECVLLQMKFTHETREIDPANIPHVKANLGTAQAAILSGPLFEEHNHE